jgi:hypothetical protein
MKTTKANAEQTDVNLTKRRKRSEKILFAGLTISMDFTGRGGGPNVRIFF